MRCASGWTSLPAPLPLAEMGCAIYQEYQRSLAYRGAVDFDDLIRLALDALRADPNLVERLRAAVAVYPGRRSPGFQPPAGGNPAPAGRGRRALGAGGRPQPGHLRDLHHRQPAAPAQLHQQHTACCARSCPIPGARRSSIIDLANHLIDWTREDHPVAEVREALHLPHILPTEPGDPQPNPPDETGQIYFHVRKMTSEEELDAVIASLMRWQEAQDELPEERARDPGGAGPAQRARLEPGQRAARVQPRPG